MKTLVDSNSSWLACAKIIVMYALDSPTLLVGTSILKFDQISQQFAVIVLQNDRKILSFNFIAADI